MELKGRSISKHRGKASIAILQSGVARGNPTFYLGSIPIEGQSPSIVRIPLNTPLANARRCKFSYD
ncbi:TPA: hypothetical protein HA335_04110 [Methanocaldococcus jannaschii]|uniref:Uncharacterized protein n=1 Tax=Methanocaldococcus jannaschii TaxID=2190 RepID=A0A832T493_9EURY|nr:hypothetical protein [Methanocaldococcus jannaschii]